MLEILVAKSGLLGLILFPEQRHRCHDVDIYDREGSFVAGREDDRMHQTDAHAEAELALGGIEALTEPRRAEPWMRPVEIAAAALLVVMIVTVLANVFFRYVLAKPLIWGDEVASISFIWMAMLGAALAVDRHEHMKLTVFLPLLPPRLARVLEVAGIGRAHV